MFTRAIDRVTAIPPLGPGFDGERHKAALVIAPGDLAATDPFFVMADDNITEGEDSGEPIRTRDSRPSPSCCAVRCRTRADNWRKAMSNG